MFPASLGPPGPSSPSLPPRCFTFETGTHPITITSSGGATTGTYTLVTSVGAMTPLPTLTFDLPVGWSADAPQIVGNDLVINITSLEGLSGYAAWKDANAGAHP